MNDSDHTFAFLERLGATKSKNEKLAILAEASEVDRDVMRRAMDPFITYGVAKVEFPKSPGARVLTYGHIHMLDRLAARQLSGNAAKLAIANAMGELTAESQQVLKRILTKDLKCGTGTTLINEIWPGLIPKFAVQLSEVYDPKRVTQWPVGFQRKLDGMRAVAIIDPDKGEVNMVSREGRPLPALEPIAEVLRSKLEIFRPWREKPIFLDGEATSGSFNDTVSQVRRKSKQADDAVFNIFDVFGPGGSAVPLEQRLELVDSIVNAFDNRRVGRVPMKLCYSDDEVQAAVNAEWDAGEEGGMVKRLDAPYELKRGYHWMKVKGYDSAEFEVLDVFEGTGKNVGTAGGYVVRLENGESCRVSGITDKDRDFIWAHRDEIKGYQLEVGFHERTPSGSLRHPRAVKLRGLLTEDKE
jgi:DNA ligase-1